MKFSLIAFYAFAFTLHSFGQSDCLVQVANEPQKQTEYRSPLVTTQNGGGDVWVINGTQAEIQSTQLSNRLDFNHLQAFVPIGSVITGIEVVLSGSGTPGMTDAVVALTTSTGELSENKANASSTGTPWTELESTWKYGGRFDTWGLDLDAATVNADDFGVTIQVGSDGQSGVARITSCKINITYQEVYSVCPDHECVIFFIQNVSNYSAFNWHTPDGFVNLDNDDSDGIYSLGVSDAPDGYYDVCVDVVGAQGPESCCRTFRLGTCATSTIGDLVFNDDNQNGIQDIGELGIPNVLVHLYDGNGNLVNSQFTDTNGSYLFVNVESGAYRVEIEGFQDYFPSYASAISNLHSGFSTDVFFLDFGEMKIDVDLGLYRAYDISGVVWLDGNCDGIYAETGSGISDLQITLFDLNNEEIIGVQTNQFGEFEFNSVPQGAYYTEVSGFDELLYTPTVLGNGQANSNTLFLSGEQALSETIFLQGNTTQFLGLKAIFHTIEGNVWLDANCDGLNTGEEAFPELLVSLYDASGNIVRTTTSSFDGGYVFDNITYGDYSVGLSGFDSDIYSPTILVADGNELIMQATGAATTNPIFITSDDIINLGLKRISYDISGFVWIDANCDGISNDASLSLESIIVSLVDGNGNTISATQASVNGNYIFPNVPIGDYSITVFGFDGNLYANTIVPVEETSGITNDLVSINNGVASTSLFELANDYTSYLGLKPILHEVSGVVWVDSNCDGIYNDEVSEVGPFGLTLIDDSGAMIATTVSEFDGSYTFSNVVYGDYRIQIEGVDNNFLVPTIIPQSGVEGQLNVLDGSTTQVFLVDSDTQVFLGLKPVLHKVSGKIWLDDNCDGFYSAGEQPIAGYTVNLIDSNDNVTQALIADSDGSYCFNEVTFGTYSITIDGYDPALVTPTVTPSNPGLDIANTLVNLDNGNYSTTTFTVNENTGIYLGLKTITYNVNGFVWEDLNCDGMFVSAEPFLAGYTLELYNMQDDLVATTESSQTGFGFGLQPVGQYYIKLIPIDNALTATVNPIVAEGNSLNVINGDFLSDIFTIGENTSIALGLKMTVGSITGVTWYDTNGNGTNDESELPLANVDIYLISCDGIYIDTVWTDDEGLYIFDNVETGSYYLLFEEPESFVFSTYVDTPENINNDINNGNGLGTTSCFEVLPGEELVYDGGYTQYASIGDFVWADLDADGLQEDGELGLAGIQVELYFMNGTAVDTTITDLEGIYEFNTVIPGSYYVKFIAPGDVQFTVMTGTNESIDSNISNEFGIGTTSAITVLAEELVSTIDAGLMISLSSIAGAVWEDESANNVRDSGDIGLFDYVVSLLDASGEMVATTTTDQSGNYRFDQLYPGNYQVRFFIGEELAFVSPNIGSPEFNSDVVNEDGLTDVIILGFEEQLTGIDAGVFGTGTISGELFIDVNANNIQDVEDNLAIDEMITVSLINAATQEVVFSVETDNGSYTFADIMPGFYFLRADLIDDHIFSAFGEGFDDNIDFNIFSISDTYGESNSILITSNDLVDNVDVGYIPDTEFGQIVGMVFIDNYANGIQDGDQGMESIAVRLYSAGGVHINAAFTDINGEFEFNNVISGEYYVDFDIPEGYFITDNEMSNNESIDSDFTLLDGFARSEAIFVIEDEAIYDVDGGIYQNASMGGEVWFDTNEDGLQGIDEPLLDNYTVIVGRGFGDNIATLSTVDGQYSLEDIKPGLYHIYIDLEGSYVFTEANVGNDESIDNDIFNQYIDFGTTSNLFIKSGENRQQIDVGFVEKESIVISSIRGQLFEDLNADGINNEDAILSGFTVSLIDVSNGIIIEQSTTDDQGMYQFSEVLSGDYVLDIAPGQEWFLTESNVGSDTTTDSDFIAAPNSVYYQFVIGETEEHLIADAGFYQLGSIGDSVWEDINENGIFDSGETGIAGVSVFLLSDEELISTTTTDSDGKYLFDQLLPGDYRIGSDIPEGYHYTESNQGAEDIDSDIIAVSGLSGSTALITIESREDNLTIDFGIIKDEVVIELSSIEGTVWEDSNANGIYETQESVISGVSVHLYNDNNTLITSTETGQNGLYTFTELTSGDYYVVFDGELIGDVVTEANMTSNELIDSDVTGLVVDYSTDIFTVAEGSSTTGLNFGLFNYASIGDIVWIDANEDGRFEDGEEGAAGVILNLFYKSSVIETYTTDSSGTYLFDNLIPGDYSISTSIPSEHFYTVANVGSEDLDSDISLSSGLSGTTSIVQLRSGDNNLDIDIGIVKEEVIVIPGSIKGVVWEDLNANGIYEIGEPRINNVTVYLYDSNNNIVDITETGDTGVDGVYAFTLLEFGEHYIIFEGEGIGDVISAPNAASDDLVDSDVTGAYNQYSTSLFEVLEGASLDGVNMGIYNYGMIGDFAWLDANEDGIQQFDENGINGIKVSLYNADGLFIGQKYTVTVDGRPGHFLFDELKPGYYQIEVDLTAGLEFTTGKAGNDNDFDSDIIDGTNMSEIVMLLSGEENISTDIGFSTLPGQIGDFVWIDTNGDGVQSSGENGLNGVMVELFDDNNVLVASTMTTSLNGEAGHFLFDNVFTGSYYMKFTLPGNYLFVKANSGNNDGLDSDVSSNISLGTTDIFSLASGIQDFDIDAGVYLPSSVGNYVWNDTNQDGIQNANESGYGGLTIDLYHTVFGFYASTMTNQDGNYIFENLPAGSYYVDVDLPNDMQFTIKQSGSNGQIDSDFSANGITSVFSLAHDAVNMDIDAGIYKTSGLVGDFIWHDMNANGLQDFDEEGLEDVAVTLMTEGMSPIRDIASNALGNYIFDDLTPGNYRVHVEAPTGYKHSQQDVGFSEEDDSDFDDSGMSDILFLDADNSRRNIDAGFYQFGQIQAGIWVDVNGDGIQNDPSVLFDGMTIDLLDKNSNTISATSIIESEGNEQYVQFDQLVPGEYYLIFHTEQFASEAMKNQGDNPMLDSDIYRFGEDLMTDIFEIRSGELKTDIAAGFVPYENQISAQVYPNPTTDALHIEFEHMDLEIEDAIVELYNAEGKLILSERPTQTESVYSINLNKFDSGVYQLYIYANGQRFAKQIIKLD